MNTKEVLQLLMKYFSPFFNLTKGIMIVGFAIFLVEFFSGVRFSPNDKQNVLLGAGIAWVFFKSIKDFFNSI